MFNVSTVDHTAHINFQTRSSIALSIVATASVIRAAFSSSHPRLLEGEAHTPVLSTNPHKKKSQGVRSGDLGDQGMRTRSSRPDRPIPSIWQCCTQKLSNPEASVRWRPILFENEVVRLFLTQIIH